MTGTDSERQLVVFELHGELYGLPITSVREIIRYVEPGATATARGPIQGMISLRDRLLPVVDLSSMLGHEPATSRQTRILIVEVRGGSLGLVVDTVDGIMHVPLDRIEPLPAAADTALGDEIAAVGDRLIVLIDAERALGGLLPKRTTRRRKATPGQAR